MPVQQSTSINYGATGHVPNNPFAFPNTIAEEQVQPQATDSYMHGDPNQRDY